MAAAVATGEKIERKYLAHYLNATPGTESETYEKIGQDLEEFTINMNADIETNHNIWGEVAINLKGYEPDASAEPYYARKGTKLFDYLQNIIDNRLTGSKVETDYVEVQTWDEATTGKYTAYKETVIVEVPSYGGDYGGYQIPFTLHFCGDRVKGKFDPSTKTFTADDAA